MSAVDPVSMTRARALWVVVLTLAAVTAAGRAWIGGAPPLEAGVAAVETAFQEERSGVWVEATGIVERLLPEDTRGARHQRFILRLTPDRTVLVSHNVDLAPPVPGLEPGDRVRFRGRYEWNPQGGVIHWTHHDPEGLVPGGWLEVESRRFR